nr:phosphatase PAP2 family protein [uncultured Clostridium sp.]
MKKRNLINFITTGSVFALFILYTILLLYVDVKPIGPNGSLVGFATVNERLHSLFGVHMWLYNITDWLGLVAILVALGFAVLGAVQLIKRRIFLRVDSNILVLGGFYLLVIAAYTFFEIFVVNYRPILIENVLEASYPSSTTMLVMCIMPTAMMQLHQRIKSKNIRVVVNSLLGLFTAFMVVGRMVSGVHWFTDILGGALLSVSLIMLYYSVNKWLSYKYQSSYSNV